MLNKISNGITFFVVYDSTGRNKYNKVVPASAGPILRPSA